MRYDLMDDAYSNRSSGREVESLTGSLHSGLWWSFLEPFGISGLALATERLNWLLRCFKSQAPGQFSGQVVSLTASTDPQGDSRGGKKRREGWISCSYISTPTSLHHLSTPTSMDDTLVTPVYSATVTSTNAVNNPGGPACTANDSLPR